jgi:hypothetical protein
VKVKHIVLLLTKQRENDEKYMWASFRYMEGRKYYIIWKWNKSRFKVLVKKHRNYFKPSKINSHNCVEYEEKKLVQLGTHTSVHKVSFCSAQIAVGFYHWKVAFLCGSFPGTNKISGCEWRITLSLNTKPSFWGEEFHYTVYYWALQKFPWPPTVLICSFEVFIAPCRTTNKRWQAFVPSDRFIVNSAAYMEHILITYILWIQYKIREFLIVWNAEKLKYIKYIIVMCETTKIVV